LSMQLRGRAGTRETRCTVALSFSSTLAALMDFVDEAVSVRVGALDGVGDATVAAALTAPACSRARRSSTSPSSRPGPTTGRLGCGYRRTSRSCDRRRDRAARLPTGGRYGVVTADHVAGVHPRLHSPEPPRRVRSEQEVEVGRAVLEVEQRAVGVPRRGRVVQPVEPAYAARPSNPSSSARWPAERWATSARRPGRRSSR
jgi:hypothetical protein